jgi:hypothetical protein
MKKINLLARYTGAMVLATMLLTACVKDKITRTYQVKTPIYEVLSTFRKQIKSQAATGIVTVGKMAASGNYIFVNELYTGIHVIDNTNPASPKNVAFINIPGNEDMAISGNTLYADAYGDLVTFDITDPVNATAKNFAANVFPDHSIYPTNGTYLNPDSVNVVVGWITKDTTVEYNPAYANPVFYDDCAQCETFAAALAPSSNAGATAQSGSLSRFAVLNKYLYTVSTSSLTSFDISSSLNPAMKSTFSVDWHVETIYPFNNNLFVGTNNGVYMYDAQSSPASPVLLGEFLHARGCDPVVANGKYAYVTINDSSACLGFNNELQIVDITNLSNSFMVASYQLTHPQGLAIDGTTLLLCDGKGGLKVYNAANVSNLQLIKQLNDGNVFDVIAQNGLAIVLAWDGIYQYDYSNLNNIHLISKL